MFVREDFNSPLFFYAIFFKKGGQNLIKLYDKDLNPVAVLENALNIGYEKKLNDIWSAQFSMPSTDEKNAECQAFRYVEIFDGDDRVDLFRILPSSLKKSEDGVITTYSCEHVLSTLLDDLIFQYYQTSNLSPKDTISDILSFQSNVRWQVGDIDFTDLFSYKWENENLLSALFSIPTAYTQDYMWTWDTSVFPWKLNLKKFSTQTDAYIRYRKNLVGITRDIDPSSIITRVYPLGYGEGVNQLTIKSVNNGIPYIDADTVNTYGVIAVPFVDKTEENPITLMAKAQAELEKCKMPKYTYSVDSIDLFELTGDSIDRLRDIGTKVQIYDEESGIDFSSYIVDVQKPNLSENPWDIKIQISNKAMSIIDSNATMLSRQKVAETYSQGAVNIDSNDYEDNCDSTHPAIVRFYLPQECVRVNKCMLSIKTSNFRAYERATMGGGAITKSSGNSQYDYDCVTNKAIWYGDYEPQTRAYTDVVSTHNHGIASGTPLSVSPSGSVSWTPSGDHAHNVRMYTHYHPLIPDGLQHTHTITLPDHTHQIDYGIYEYPQGISSVTIKVDGNVIPVTNINATDINIVPYLSVDNEGKISRGAFHSVEIVPNTTTSNPNGLARITATVTKQIFVQSRGGGDY